MEWNLLIPPKDVYCSKSCLFEIIKECKESAKIHDGKCLLFYKKEIGAGHCISFIHGKLGNTDDKEAIDIDSNSIITEYMLIGLMGEEVCIEKTRKERSTQLDLLLKESLVGVNHGKEEVKENFD